MKWAMVHARMSGDIHEHLVTLYSLVVGSDAKTVVELGVRTGQSTVALAEAVTFTQGVLHSVDIADCSEVKKRLDEYGIGSCWRFTQTDSRTFGRAWDASKPIDLVFLDTSHQYQDTVEEIAVFESLLKRGGLFVFHDTTSCPDGVLRPIQELMLRSPGWRFDNHEWCAGLGILKKYD